ncbi:hypothetical protein HKCCSP123_04500 [Rhodobacterales bacterium HKCCSP123]|nr:hypothetical protein [Rhodobacterales bacterium HKCCSP123]
MLLALPILAGCVETAGPLPDRIPVGGISQLPDRVPVGADGQEQVCAAAFADQRGLPISAIRVNGRDTAPSGNTVVFLQTADLFSRATCEVNDFGNVLSIVSTS